MTKDLVAAFDGATPDADVARMTTSAPPPLSRRDSRKHDKRSAIVSAAKDSFLKNGYALMSMSGLVATLGGSKATLWSYFRSKEELFAAVLEDAAGDYGRAMAGRLLSSDDLRGGLVTFSRDLMRKMLSHEGLELYRLVTAESGRFPEVGKLFYTLAAGPVEASLTDYLRRYMDQGALPQDDPGRAARTLLALCHALPQRRLWGLETFDDEAVEAEASRIADVVLRAYGPAGAP
jgi:AcrR family transcriptional regulator